MDAQAHCGENQAPEGQIFVWLPDLYGTGRTLACEKAYPLVARLDPGLPARMVKESEARAFVPPNLPFGKEDMAAYVRELERFAAESVSGSDVLCETMMQGVRDEEERRAREERAAVEALLQGGCDSEAREREMLALRQKSQRLLAWLWLQQKDDADMADIVERINRDVASMKASFAAERVDDFGDLAQIADFAVAGERKSSNLRVLLKAACVLCPEDTIFVLTEPFGEFEDVARKAAPCEFTAGLGENVPGVRIALEKLVSSVEVPLRGKMVSLAFVSGESHGA